MRTPEAKPDPRPAARAELLCDLHARKTAIDSPPCVPQATHEALQKNYRALFDDYATALAWLNRLHRERTDVDGLAAWAIVSGHEVRLTNQAFDRLDRASHRDMGWREMICTVPSPVHIGPSFPTLRALALGQAEALGESRRGMRTRRFHRGSAFIEISVERTSNELGEVTTFVVVHDVAALVEMERRVGALERHVAHQESVRKLGEVSAGVAHDLQNLLAALRCRLTAFELTHGMSDGDAASVQAMHDIIGSGSALVAKLHAAAHPAAPEPMAVDLESVVASAIEIAESTFEVGSRGDGTLAVRVAFPPLPQVWGSADDLRDVFLHLLLNARDAMPSGGAVWLHAEALDDAVIVRVEDEGTGIAPGLGDRIFEPFFTTKKHDGTGVGLALARQTMRQAGGDITAGNRSSGGACFELRFALPGPATLPGSTQNADTSGQDGSWGIAGP